MLSGRTYAHQRGDHAPARTISVAIWICDWPGISKISHGPGPIMRWVAFSLGTRHGPTTRRPWGRFPSSDISSAWNRLRVRDRHHLRDLRCPGRRKRSPASGLDPYPSPPEGLFCRPTGTWPRLASMLAGSFGRGTDFGSLPLLGRCRWLACNGALRPIVVGIPETSRLRAQFKQPGNGSAWPFGVLAAKDWAGPFWSQRKRTPSKKFKCPGELPWIECTQWRSIRNSDRNFRTWVR